MTPEQRYMLDTQGFLHIRHALSAHEIAQARLAADDYVATAAAARAGGPPLPADFSGNGEGDGKGCKQATLSSPPARPCWRSPHSLIPTCGRWPRICLGASARAVGLSSRGLASDSGAHR
jgi:hypothetical protein